MKVNIGTLFKSFGLVALLITVVALFRFYPDLRRYVKMKTM